jgi:Domain of unknown function (DUF1996)
VDIKRLALLAGAGLVLAPLHAVNDAASGIAVAVAQTVPSLPRVDAALIPPPRSGHKGPLVVTNGQMPKPAGDGVGAWRTNCGVTHFNFDDPIVFPGVRNATHLHVYFGNNAVDYRSTAKSLREEGDSSCTGGTLNRTAYWVPAMIDTRNGQPLVPQPLSIYYKVGYTGPGNAAIKPFPQGLRMIAGNAKSTRAQDTSIVMFHCHDRTGAMKKSATIPPDCASGQALWGVIEFPKCWDGSNLDSPDHKSHMAYPQGRSCPASHPVPIPQISYNVVYVVPATGDTAHWRLASDIDGTPAGSSSHADWYAAWDQDIVDSFVTQVLNRGLDGETYMLGDGRVLGGQP